MTLFMDDHYWMVTLSTLLPLSPPTGKPKTNTFGSAALFSNTTVGRLRAGFNAVGLNGDYVPGPNDITINGNIDVDLKMLSLEYNVDKWQFTTEYQRRDIDLTGIFAPGFHNNLPSESYYLQTTYQLTPSWRLLGRYDVLYLDKNDKAGRRQVLLGNPESIGFAKDSTVSLRYDLSDAWTISAEYHDVRGTGWLSRSDNPDRSKLKENWRLFTLQVGFQF